MIRAVPAVTPVIKPVDEPIVATDVFALLHVPPPVSDKVEVEFTQRESEPVGVVGLGFTVTVVVVLATPHPLVMV